MKKVFVLFVLLFLALPCFAFDEKARLSSLDFLNKLVVQNNLSEKVESDMNNDYMEISRIIKLYKINPLSIKTTEINTFGNVCSTRNKKYLDEFENDYFKPSYEEYKKLDKTNTPLTYDEWINTTAMSEISKFYDFYTMIENNYEDCNKIILRSK